MDYLIKLYTDQTAFDKRDFLLLSSRWGSMASARLGAIAYLKQGQYHIAKVFSDDDEGIEILKGRVIDRDRLKLVQDGYSLNIYIENGGDEEPTHVAYWVDDEWMEDAESVVPAMLNAMELFYTNPELLLEKLGLEFILVD